MSNAWVRAKAWVRANAWIRVRALVMGGRAYFAPALGYRGAELLHFTTPLARQGLGGGDGLSARAIIYSGFEAVITFSVACHRGRVLIFAQFESIVIFFEFPHRPSFLRVSTIGPIILPGNDWVINYEKR